MKQKNYHSKAFIGIDPGKSGGICCIQDNRLWSSKCPDSVQGMSELFQRMLKDINTQDITLCIEKVWAMPHDGKSSIFSFGQNYGQWEGVIASSNIVPIYVTPSLWMKHFEIPKGLDKKDRKNLIKQMAQEFINSNNYMSYQWRGVATLATADAIMLAKYAIDKTD
tara:strand:- start:592 stop:1089 length:498 start_codon:yes stop_codon:yes gene_type:complete